MSVAIDSIHKLDIFFDAGENVPPPFHYAYHLELGLKAEKLDAHFDLRYLHREELSEEDIIDEGFTLNDDWHWQGNLPDVWQQALQEQLQKSIWPNKPKEPEEGEAILEIQLLGKGGELLFSGRPADPQAWEYFLQELMQAIFEIGQKEAPLSLHYTEIHPKHVGLPPLEIWLEASFAKRMATARQQGLETAKQKELSWPALKKLMKTVYMPEYDYEQAQEERPKKPGKHLNTGEGLWFTFGESLLEPAANTDSLARLEEALKGLFSK